MSASAGCGGACHESFTLEIRSRSRISPTRAVAQDGAAGYSGHVLEGLAERLDHHLLLADQFIHQQAEPLPFDFGDYQHAGQRVFALRLHVEDPVKPHHRQ